MAASNDTAADTEATPSAVKRAPKFKRGLKYKGRRVHDRWDTKTGVIFDKDGKPAPPTFYEIGPFHRPGETFSESFEVDFNMKAWFAHYCAETGTAPVEYTTTEENGVFTCQISCKELEIPFLTKACSEVSAEHAEHRAAHCEIFLRQMIDIPPASKVKYLHHHRLHLYKNVYRPFRDFINYRKPMALFGYKRNFTVDWRPYLGSYCMINKLGFPKYSNENSKPDTEGTPGKAKAFLTVGDKKFEVECCEPGIKRGPIAAVDKAEGDGVDERDYRCLSEMALREFEEITELESWHTASQETKDMRKAVSSTVYSMLDPRKNKTLDTRKRKGNEKNDDGPMKKKFAEKPTPHKTKLAEKPTQYTTDAPKTGLERLRYQMTDFCKTRKLPPAKIDIQEIDENGYRAYRCTVKADGEEFTSKKKKRAYAEKGALSVAVNTLKRKHKVDLDSSPKKAAPSILDLPPLVPPTHVAAAQSPPPVPHHRGVYQQPRGNTQQQRGNYQQSRGNYPQPRGNYPQPRGNTQQPSGNYHQPRGNYHPPRGIYHPPRENYPQSRGNTQHPNGNYPQPRGSTQQPRGDTQQSMGNQPQARKRESTGNAGQKPMTDEKKFRLDEKNRLKKAAEPRQKLFQKGGKVTANPWLDDDL